MSNNCNHCENHCGLCGPVMDYRARRTDIARREAQGEPIAPKEWEALDDLAHAIVRDLADNGEPVEPAQPRPDAEPYTVTLPRAQWGAVLDGLDDAKEWLEESLELHAPATGVQGSGCRDCDDLGGDQMCGDHTDALAAAENYGDAREAIASQLQPAPEPRS